MVQICGASLRNLSDSLPVCRVYDCTILRRGRSDPVPSDEVLDGRIIHFFHGVMPSLSCVIRRIRHEGDQMDDFSFPHSGKVYRSIDADVIDRLDVFQDA